MNSIHYNQEKISVVAKELDKKGVFKTYLSYISTFVISRSVAFLSVLTDNWILSHMLGATALGVASCVLPLHQWTHFAASLFDGFHIYISHSFGENNKHKVNSIFTLTLYLMLILTAISTFIYLNSPMILNWLSGSPGGSNYLVKLGCKYLFGVTWGLFPMFALSALSYMVRIDGSRYLPTISNIVTLISNIVLNFLLIGKFRYFGAGIATSISYWIGFFILSTHFLKRTNTYRLLKSAKSSGVSFKKLIGLICPRLAHETAKICNVTFLTILGFRSFGIIFGTVSGIYSMAHQFIYIAIIGTVEASKPLLGVAYGQKNYSSLHQTLRSMYTVVLLSVGILCIIMFIFPQCFPLLLNLHPYDVAFIPACTAIRLLTIYAMIYALSFIYRIYYQQTGQEKFVAVVNLLESTLFVIPFYYLLSHIENTDGFWWANIYKEIITLVIFLAFHLWQNKKLKDKYLGA